MKLAHDVTPQQWLRGKWKNYMVSSWSLVDSTDTLYCLVLQNKEPTTWKFTVQEDFLLWIPRSPGSFPKHICMSPRRSHKWLAGRGQQGIVGEGPCIRGWGYDVCVESVRIYVRVHVVEHVCKCAHVLGRCMCMYVWFCISESDWWVWVWANVWVENVGKCWNGVCVCLCVCMCEHVGNFKGRGKIKWVNSHCWSWESPQEVSLAHECFRVDGQTTSLVPDVASPGAGPASSWSQGWLQCAFLDPRPVSLGPYSQSSIWKLPLISSCPENPSSIDSLHLQAPACFAKGGNGVVTFQKAA